MTRLRVVDEPSEIVSVQREVATVTESPLYPLALLRRDIVAAFIVLVLVVIAWTLNSILHPQLENGDLDNVAVMVAKDLDPTLLPTDYAFSDQSYYQSYTPIYRWIVRYLWQWSGNFELGLVWLAPGVLTVYLAGMFILLHRITGNTWLALGLTVASAHYHETMGGEVWGVGGSTQLMARALFTAVAPYLLLLFLEVVRKPSLFKVAVLGLAVGGASNLHPGSGMHLSVLLASTLVVVYGFRREGKYIWSMLPVMVLATLVGAWPILQTVIGGFGQNTTGLTVPFTAFKRALDERIPLYFYPRFYEWHGIKIIRPNLDVLVWIYVGLALIGLALYLWICWKSSRSSWWWRWAWLVGGLVTVGYAYMIALFEMSFLFGLVGLYILYRFVYPDFKFLDWLMVGMMVIIILQSFVGYYLLSLVWDTFELQSITPVLIEQFRSARFIYLPVYILAGLASAVLVLELAALTRRIVKSRTISSQNSASAFKEPAFAVLIGLFLCLLPGLPNLSNWQPWFLVVLGFIVLISLVGLVWRAQSQRWSLLYAVTGMVLITGGLFGPLAPLFAPLSPIPTVNLLNPAERIPEPLWPKSDAQLYQWVRENTSPDALFFWCTFGPSTTLRFRREAQRSITHNWKDLGWIAYRGTILVPLLDHYRKLERACESPAQALAAAYEVGADYILVPPAQAIGWKSASCFANDRYLVFGLGPHACD